MIGTAQSAAAGVGDGMLLSSDGSNWASALDRPIFSGSFVYVPGSSNTGSVWIKNNSDRPAILAAAAITTYGPPDLTRHLGLQVKTRKRTTEGAALADSGGCVDLLAGWPMQSGESLRLDFVLQMHEEAPNAAMQQSAEVDVRLLMEGDGGTASLALSGGSACAVPAGTVVPGTVMRDLEPGASTASRPEDARAGAHVPAAPLAFTGLSGLGGWVGASTLVVVLGVVLVIFGRRRKAGVR
jgi:hypothetical protein